MPAYGRQESETDESRLSLVVSRDDNVSAFRTAPSARNPATRMGIREVSQSLPVRFRRLLVFMKIALMTEGTYPTQKDGRVRLPEASGLGIRVNFAEFKRKYPYKEIRGRAQVKY